MAVFSAQPLKKWFFKKISSKWPPQEESKCKNPQFLQLILKGDVVYFHKITASQIWGNSFIVKNIGILHNMLPPQYCVTGPRWVKWEMGDFSKLIKNTVNHHNLTHYTSLSEKTTILTPAIFLIKWEMGDFSKLIKNTVNHHNLTHYTSLSEKTTILTPAIFLIKWEMGDFSKLIKNTVNHHNLTHYTSLSEKTTILTPAIFLINSSWPGGLAKMGHF